MISLHFQLEDQLETEATACAAGERCSPAPDNKGPILFSTDQLYCGSAGAGARGAACAYTSDCAAGLVCHVSKAATQGLCAPPCGEGFAACESPDVCSVQGDGEGTGSYPTAVRGCERLAQAGEDCRTASCAPPTACIKMCTDSSCTSYSKVFCAPPCITSTDCPSALPYCFGSFCIAP